MSMSSKPNRNEIAEPQATSTLVETLETSADNPASGEKTDMRAMRADKFSGYEGLKLVDLQNQSSRTEECCCE